MAKDVTQMRSPRAEEFARAFARAQHECEHIQVPAQKIDVDLSATAVLDRLADFIGEARTQGLLSDAERRDALLATRQLKSVLARVDEAAVIRGLRARR